MGNFDREKMKREDGFYLGKMIATGAVDVYVSGLQLVDGAWQSPDGCNFALSSGKLLNINLVIPHLRPHTIVDDPNAGKFFKIINFTGKVSFSLGTRHIRTKNFYFHKNPRSFTTNDGLMFSAFTGWCATQDKYGNFMKLDLSTVKPFINDFHLYKGIYGIAK